MPRILIVDDNLALAENLAEILQDHGYETQTYADPRRALAETKPGQYALALMDMRMPHMSGVELYRALSKVDPALPAVVMTAWSQSENTDAALGAGIYAVVSKPVALPNLTQLFHTLLEGPAALVVDDDPAFAANLVEILQLNGVAARGATSCAQAREVLAGRSPEVLVVDSRLPDGNGADLLKELCQKGSNRHCFLVSAWEPGPEKEALLKEQCITFMAKPLNVDSLLKDIAHRTPS